ncbi:NAD(P)/FAD-dependent oxidoreductase [Chondromyces apiculatus]|uniref:FAD dependent oxidoreductase n=1 Tax=Chondromyces apiculatus DSM 436 TaxID=1192034 RepID=A0A017TAV3_9BACT|nr:FAD-binding oxidoreductase [Chondromyces apiculatus]EYF06027.1 FAD dependent oxidoreductase [Chondromyces apiculatus DSM 436]
MSGAPKQIQQIDPARSIWTAEGGPYDPSPPLHGDISADVAIIGGGFTGISTAYHLSRRFPERRIVVLEAKHLANGASGRNGGMMLNWVNGIGTDDPALTKLVYDTTRGGIDDIVALIARHDLKVRHRRDGCMEVLTDARRAEAAHARVERLNAMGIPVVFLDRTALASRLGIHAAEGAVYDPTEGHLHGVDFLRALKPVVQSQGVTVYEQTPVLRVYEGPTHTLLTPRGTVRADAIVLATNAYTPALGYFRTGLFAMHSHVLATAPLTPEQRAAIGWGTVTGFTDDMDRISYGCLNNDGAIVFGGGGNAAYDYHLGGSPSFKGSDEHATQAMQNLLYKYFPALSGVPIVHRWSGPLGITMSRVCSMGVMGDHRNVYYGLGYSGHGVTLANLAGRVITDIYAGEGDRWRGQPFYMKRLTGVPPEPFRKIGYEFYTRLTGKSPRRTD